MISAVSLYARRHAVGLAALVLAVGGTSYAVATPSSPRQIRICIQAHTGELYAAGPTGHCRRGERSFIAGERGLRGQAGPQGPRGLSGATGSAGAKGDPGTAGAQGLAGAQGVTGPSGATGPVGPSEYAEFFALIPPDNGSTVATGSAVQFPQNGPSSGAIVRSGPGTFVLPSVGTYRVAFSVSVDEAGQLELQLNAVGLAYTVYGRATGTSEISGDALVTTSTVNSVLSVVNPSGNSTALTVTPLAGGTHAAAASLTIERVH